MTKHSRWLSGALLFAAAMWCRPIGHSWAQHEGHGMTRSMHAPGDRAGEEQDAKKALQGRLVRLQEKIDKTEAALQKPDLTAKKRAALKEKLEKLYSEKTRLLTPGKEQGGKAAVKGKPTAKEVYACPMGDYRGPKTPDGRCPKCGMNLQKQ